LILQVIFREAYWLRFWAQLQHKAQAKDTLIAMSRKLEVVALQIANRGWNQFFSFTLVGGLLPVCCFFTPFVDVSFELFNFWLCPSSDVEAGFNYPISKKIYSALHQKISFIFSFIDFDSVVQT
jgi:hypothetical protein